MENFNVKVQSNEQMRVVDRFNALKEAKRQAALMLARGWKPKQVFVLFHHEVTLESLGTASLIDAETMVIDNIDDRILTLEGLLAPI